MNLGIAILIFGLIILAVGIIGGLIWARSFVARDTTGYVPEYERLRRRGQQS